MCMHVASVYTCVCMHVTYVCSLACVCVAPEKSGLTTVTTMQVRPWPGHN